MKNDFGSLMIVHPNPISDDRSVFGMSTLQMGRENGLLRFYLEQIDAIAEANCESLTMWLRFRLTRIVVTGDDRDTRKNAKICIVNLGVSRIDSSGTTRSFGHTRRDRQSIISTTSLAASPHRWTWGYQYRNEPKTAPQTPSVSVIFSAASLHCSAICSM